MGILTGNGDNYNNVDVFSLDGWIMELPQLITGRAGHGCGHFINTDNEMVYLVAGGGDFISANALSSTETLVNGAAVRTESGQLPLGLYQSQSLSLTNKIWLTGGYNGTYYTLDYILQFNPSDESWTQVGQLKVARRGHGISVVNSEDVIDFCID